jgi:hypothetical protein
MTKLLLLRRLVIHRSARALLVPVDVFILRQYLPLFDSEESVRGFIEFF